VFKHVDSDVIVINTLGGRVDAGEAAPLSALLVGCVLTRAGAAVAPVVVTLGCVLGIERRVRREKQTEERCSTGSEGKGWPEKARVQESYAVPWMQIRPPLLTDVFLDTKNHGNSPLLETPQ